MRVGVKHPILCEEASRPSVTRMIDREYALGFNSNRKNASRTCPKEVPERSEGPTVTVSRRRDTVLPKGGTMDVGFVLWTGMRLGHRIGKNLANTDSSLISPRGRHRGPEVRPGIDRSIKNGPFGVIVAVQSSKWWVAIGCERFDVAWLWRQIDTAIRRATISCPVGTQPNFGEGLLSVQPTAGAHHCSPSPANCPGPGETSLIRVVTDFNSYASAGIFPL